MSEEGPNSHLMKAQLGLLCEPLRDKPKIPKILRNYISAEVGREAAVRKEPKNKRGVRNAGEGGCEQIDDEDLRDPCKHDSLRQGSTMTMLMVHDDLYQKTRLSARSFCSSACSALGG